MYTFHIPFVKLTIPSWKFSVAYPSDKGFLFYMENSKTITEFENYVGIDVYIHLKIFIFV